MLRRTAGLVLTLALTACSGEVMGPEPVDDGPTAPDPSSATVERVEIAGTDDDTLTLQQLGDTVRLEAVAYDADGNELSLDGREVAWASSDTSVMKVNERGAFLIPDSVWLNTSNGGVIFLDGAPESEGPKPATLTVTVDGVEAAREFVQDSPVWGVGVSPSGSCVLAPGQYEDPYSGDVVVVESPVEKDATVEARDYWGRIEPLEFGDAGWASTDEAVATVEASETDPEAATAFVTDAGFTDIEGTVNGITDVYAIEASDSVAWNPPEERDEKGQGSVACTTGPAS